MKRPPGIWILLSAGVLWLSFQDVYGIRATSLIFGKSTTTTPPAPVANATDKISDSESTTEASAETSNVTKPSLTGIPQIDYKYDPNLPKELNGYNLSEYPFYERVPDPEEIDFKCDGLHDGFYASIPFKCQVYHHCLFGTRYDFLCANYTAFDQKTFICQFVSDVDCVGSKKFWHRNDALYKAATTTTSKPLNIYTPPPEPVAEQEGGKVRGAHRGGGNRRRPIQRRPQYDYYDYTDYEDDYYEDRPRSRRRRPRPRPRPIYDDEYESDYEDEAYERRNRRPYNRRGTDRRRNKNRNKNDGEDKESDATRDASSTEERRKPPKSGNRKPPRDDEDDYDTRPKRTRKRPQTDEEPEETRPKKKIVNHEEEEKPLIKPTTGTIYDRPRVAPRIKPPVPKNEANKYAYKPISKPTKPLEDDYYEDEEEEARPPKTTTPKPKQREEEKPKLKGNSNRGSDKFRNRFKPTTASSEEDVETKDKSPELKVPEKPKVEKQLSTTTEGNIKNKSTPIPETSSESEYYYDEDYEIETPKVKPTQRTTTTTTTQRTTTTTTESNKERTEQIVRIVKRPFLPSRGGNPYSARGLQPVGFKAQPLETMEPQGSSDVPFNTKNKPPTSRFTDPISQTDDDDFIPVKRPPHILRPTQDDGPRPTQKPKIPYANPLDITENEYDVTLNDALNPTISNLPGQTKYPTGFSPANDYTFSAFQRPRFASEQTVGATSDYLQQAQRFEVVPQNQASTVRVYYSPVSNVKRGVQTQSRDFYRTNY